MTTTTKKPKSQAEPVATNFEREREIVSAAANATRPPQAASQLSDGAISLMAEASAEIGEISAFLATRADAEQDWLGRGMAQRIDALNDLVYSLATGEFESSKSNAQAAYGRTQHLCHGGLA